MKEIKVKYFCSNCKKYYDSDELDDFLLKECEPDEFEYYCPVDNEVLKWTLM